MSKHWTTLQHIHEWIRFADAKAGVVVAAQSAIAVATAPALLQSSNTLIGHPWILVLVALGGACGVITLLLGALVILPKTSVGEPLSLVFFDHISRAYKTPEAYVEHAKRHLDSDGD